MEHQVESHPPKILSNELGGIILYLIGEIEELQKRLDRVRNI